MVQNERVLVERVVAAAGEPLGDPSDPRPHLRIGIPGGEVAWLDGRDPSRAGPALLDVVRIVPKALDPRPWDDGRRLVYPSKAGIDLLENDRVIVQRFDYPPGEWEGVHAHDADMLFVHLTDGRWASRSYRDPYTEYPPSPAGFVGWMDRVGLEAGHESCNVGPEQIDLIWVTLK